MKIKLTFAILICKSVRTILRVLKRGGTALPGKIALKVCPDMLEELARGVDTVVVTGTNGKTTTSRIIEQAFTESGQKYVANRSGANLITGITTEFAMNADLAGRPRAKIAVIECDEAASKAVLGYIRPKVVLVTNLFRDQLDRFGEITHTLDSIKEGISKTPGSILCLNADDSLVASIASEVPNEVVFYGLDAETCPDRLPEQSDAPHCIRCKTEYEYDWHSYGHLGGFRCPNCGYSRQNPQVYAAKVLARDADSTTVEMDIDGRGMQVHINLPAIYNVYNAVGAAAALTRMGFSPEQAVRAAENFSCGFGRMEKFALGNTTLRMILVKNPAGCNQVMNYLSALSGGFTMAIGLNDNIADGTDISWIWDAEFEKLVPISDRLSEILVFGKRRAAMALRLKYAGIDMEKVKMYEDYEQLIKDMGERNEPVFIMPTYTSMLELRSHLSRICGEKEFWE